MTVEPTARHPAGPGMAEDGFAAHNPAGRGLTRHAMLAELGRLLAEVTGEDEGWTAAISPDSRLDCDLRLDSVEWAAFADRVAQRYGDRADLWAYLAGLDIRQIVALTIGDVAGYLAGQLAGPAPAVQAGGAARANTAGDRR